MSDAPIPSVLKTLKRYNFVGGDCHPNKRGVWIKFSETRDALKLQQVANAREEFPLAQIVGDKITIEIPIESLHQAVTCIDSLYFDDDDNEAPPIITDLVEFAKEFVCELNREQENGDTPIHLIFDKAIEDAIENGAAGIVTNTEREEYAEAKGGAK